MNQDLIQNLLTEIDLANISGKRPTFSYERISNDVQKEGVSLSSQKFGSESYSDRMGLRIVHCFNVVESAWKEGRKTFNLMLDLVAKFPVKNIIFKNIDRMSRNYNDLQKLKNMVLHQGLNIHFYESGRVLSKESNYDDLFILDIEIAVAKRHVEKISYDIKKTNLFKAQKGIAPSRTPFGYIYDTNEKMHKIDPVREHEVRFMFDEFDANRYSLTDFAILLNEKNIKTSQGSIWRRGALHYVLTNPFYHGEFFYDGRILAGKHQPYYEKERYTDRIKRLGDKFLGSKKRTFDFKLARFIKCTCGRVLTGEYKKNQYVYYSHICEQTGTRKYLSEAGILQSINTEVETARFHPNFADQLRELFKNYNQPKKATVRQEMGKVTRQITEFQLKKQKLLDLFAEDKIAKQDIEIGMERYQRRIDSLQRELKTVTQNHDNFIIQVSDIINRLRDMPLTYLKVPDEGKVEILKSMASGAIIDGSEVKIQWDKPFSFLMKPEILELNKDDLESSKSSYCAPEPGLEPGTQ